jgi:hypothetical protein
VDLDWSGEYRFEGNFFKNLNLDKNSGIETSYLTHHLILQPKIIATDGLTIRSRFDVFNNSVPGNTIGQTFGSYGNAPGTTGAPNPPATTTHTQNDESILVTQLYLSWINEFSAVVIGRVPFQFGLGMVYNSGNGIFDHFQGTKDIVSYKLIWGNLTLMPAYGKVREGFLNNEDDVNDYMVVAEYSNPESNISMGVMFDQKVAPQDGSAPLNGNDFPSPSGAQGTYNGGYSAYNLNAFVKKQWDNFNFGGELGFLSGNSGLQIPSATSPGTLSSVGLSGFGLATELSYKTGEIVWGLHTGLASGDDPDTANYEGYTFSPNYDVAMLMFNRVLGQYDMLRTGAVSGTRPTNSAYNGLDTEVISNAIYVAPDIKWSMGEKYDLLGNFCYATLQKPAGPAAGWSRSNTIGYETDIGLNYHPNNKFTWVTTIGVLFPGSSFGGVASSNQAFPTDPTYGATTKAAVSF